MLTNEALSKPSILVINYYWPPSGGPAVQRWLAYSKSLIDAGWDVHILTVDPKYATYPSIDNSLEAGVHPSIKVHRTKTFELFNLYRSTVGRGKVPTAAFANESNPGPLRRIARFIRGNFFLPDARKGWKRYALPEAVRIADQFRIGTVITCGPPHSTHFIGMALKKMRSIVWVVDFHDGWTDVSYYHHFMHTKLASRIDASMEKDVLEEADHVLTLGERLKAKLIAKSKLISKDKVSVVTMGYDAQVFAKAKHRWPEDVFTITYTGTIADFYEPESFIDALSIAHNALPEVPLSLKLVGLMSENLIAHIAKSGLDPITEYIPTVPHEQAIDYMVSTSVLWLVGPKYVGDDHHIPGKLFEYLASAKPIINIGPQDSETADILQETGLGKTFSRQEVQALSEYLLMLMKSWLENKNLSLASTYDVEKYSRKEEGERLSMLLAGLALEARA